MRVRLSRAPHQTFDGRARQGNPKAVKMDNGCWAWGGNLDEYGTAVIEDGSTMGAHRYVYELVHGTVPAGYHVHHKCHNPGCVAPEHLIAVTPFEHKRIHMGRNDPDPAKNLLAAILDTKRDSCNATGA